MIGVHGVLAFSVAERRRELGVRMALGATRRQIVGPVLARGLGLTTAGITIGLACSWTISRFVESFLYGVTPSDPVTMCLVVAVVLAASLASCASPAIRAARVDPLVALRHD